MPTPADKAVYAQFVRIKEIRDSVTHFKRHDEARLAGDLHEPTALFKLFLSDQYAIPENAMSLIEYFSKATGDPRWMRNPQWTRSVADDSAKPERWAESAHALRKSHGVVKPK